MATVICDVQDCIHRSRRPLKKWKYSNGVPCYGCKLPTIRVSLIFDPDGYCETVIGRTNMAHCSDYTPTEDEL